MLSATHPCPPIILARTLRLDLERKKNDTVLTTNKAATCTEPDKSQKKSIPRHLLSMFRKGVQGPEIPAGQVDLVSPYPF